MRWHKSIIQWQNFSTYTIVVIQFCEWRNVYDWTQTNGMTTSDRSSPHIDRIIGENRHFFSVSYRFSSRRAFVLSGKKKLRPFATFEYKSFGRLTSRARVCVCSWASKFDKINSYLFRMFRHMSHAVCISAVFFHIFAANCQSALRVSPFT